MPPRFDSIAYKEGYKYQLVEDACIRTSIFPVGDVEDTYIRLQKTGLLEVKSGYAWDGPSGPTFDTKSSMRASLFHDALYQLMRLGLLREAYRISADSLLRTVCLTDGMNPVRAVVWEEMVRLFAAGAARSGSERKIIIAP